MSIHRFSLTWMGAAISVFVHSTDVCVLTSLESLSFSTLIDSTPGVLVARDSFGRECGFDGAAAAHDGHGRRLAESLVEKCNLETPEEVAVRPLFPRTSFHLIEELLIRLLAHCHFAVFLSWNKGRDLAI